MKNNKYYTLCNGMPVPANFEAWAEWIDTANVIVAKTKVGKVEVSTVFLGIDHAPGSGSPVLWETMVFGGKHDELQRRCRGNWEQAEAMHAEVVKWVEGDK
jgi:hypothetical protein